ncbi:hypothetical protein KCU59_g82, partial [Aureobasidium melanogenum]
MCKGHKSGNCLQLARMANYLKRTLHPCEAIGPAANGFRVLWKLTKKTTSPRATPHPSSDTIEFEVLGFLVYTTQVNKLSMLEVLMQRFRLLVMAMSYFTQLSSLFISVDAHNINLAINPLVSDVRGISWPPP